MNIEEYLQSIGIKNKGTMSDGAYVIDMIDSDEYGKVYSKLERCDDLDVMENNQVVTEQGVSITYISNSEPYILDLLADLDGNVYQLVINNIDEL